MKERPIIFSTEMVRAILEGRKSQTRRIVKPQPTMLSSGIWKWHHYYTRDLRTLSEILASEGRYQIDDRLWVRETWTMEYNVGPNTHESGTITIGYKATPDVFMFKNAKYIEEVPSRKSGWRPSIHMPRWASRLMLRVLSVRVEQLQDIGSEDIEAEGIPKSLCIYHHLNWKSYDFEEHRRLFVKLWDGLNKKRGFGYAMNPWVYVVKFRAVQE